MAEVSLKDIRKSFGSINVIKGVDIQIEDGEFVVFVGPSGCGKSTLLRMIAGLEDVTAGTLAIGGKIVNDLPPKDRSIAMVFQSYAIFPHMTVRENIAFGLTVAGASKQEKAEKVAEAASILQMESLLDRRPNELSGGQRQRVAIGRAITRKPSVFLFDEPLSNLDAALRMSMRMEIGKLHQQLDATMIYVTHDQVEAMTLADKIVVLKDGQVMQVGAPMDVYHNPANQFVAGFIGSPRMNFLPVEIVSAEGGTAIVRSSDIEQVTVTSHQPVKAGETAVLGIRPQYLRYHDGQETGGHLKGQVQLSERLGTETVVSFELSSGGSAIASLSGDEQVEIGTEIVLDFDPASAHLFPPE
jgi:multiple sugar transport system ATP-binding protein